MSENGDEIIRIGHPDTEATGTVPRHALDALWKDKGWYEVPDEDNPDVQTAAGKKTTPRKGELTNG